MSEARKEKPENLEKATKIDAILGGYKLVLGLEIHLHVKTDSKMFCGCSTKNIYTSEPNSHVCPVCLGLPGALPVPNKEAVEKTHLLGRALDCKINENSKFDRKHYFYPDLPKGYQISQYKEPLCEGGFVNLPNGRKVELERIHLEEDTAKSFHEGDLTTIDFNKSGMALIEMVTKPSIYFVEDAVEYAKQIQEIVRHLEVGEADMEKGQLRIEPNISLRTAEMEEAGELPSYKVEVKNINSFRFLEKAIVSEIKRQREILESGETPAQENRGYNESTGKTVLQRSKEEAHDYRYFPEPDIPPMVFDSKYREEMEARLRAYLPLPLAYCKELESSLGITEQMARVLIKENLVPLVGEISEEIRPKVINLLVHNPELRGKSSQELEEYVKSQESSRINDLSQLEEVVTKVLEKNSQIIQQIREGNMAPIEFLLGQVMKETRGKANALMVRGIITRKLEI